jgi:hypothetical protein
LSFAARLRWISAWHCWKRRSLRERRTGRKLVVSVLSEVAGAATDTSQTTESVLSASQAVEAAAAELRREVEGFLARVAA